MNEHPTKQPPLYTKDEVVKDILENMNIDEKANVKHTPEEKLYEFHFGWGQYLRNYYQMWHNPELVNLQEKNILMTLPQWLLKKSGQYYRG